jgi:hypothetical protein
METCFYTNMCALRESLGILRKARGLCKKRQKQILSYTIGLIDTNETIYSLHNEISQRELSEFNSLYQEYMDIVRGMAVEETCKVCGKNCLQEGFCEEEPERVPEEDASEEESDGCVDTRPTSELRVVGDEEMLGMAQELRGALSSSEKFIVGHSSRSAEIERIFSKMKSLDRTARFVESVVDLQGEGIEHTFDAFKDMDMCTKDAVGDLEAALKRKKRNQMVKRWACGSFVFLLFASLLIVKSLLPSF